MQRGSYGCKTLYVRKVKVFGRYNVTYGVKFVALLKVATSIGEYSNRMKIIFEKNLFRFSFDLRDKHSSNAKPWSSPNIFKNRATFAARKQPALLIIDMVTMEDETVYRCRVDFQNSPTRNSKVNLTIIG